MTKENLAPNAHCARAEDLVTYLYGESGEWQEAEFKSHLEECASCSDELAAFSLVREEVIEWRNRSLPSFEPTYAQGLSGAAATARKPSALAALREFFTLAPTWMRAATAMAALLVCALVVFTAMHFAEPAQVVQVVPSAPTQAQVEEMVKRRVEEIRQQEKQEAVASAQEKQPGAVVRDNNAVARAKPVRNARTSTYVARQQPLATPLKVKASRAAREQLAELVQTSREDDGLPRLSDLFEDSNESQ